jgi:hypothetical protein
MFKAKIAGERNNYLVLDMESGGIGWGWQEIPVYPKPKLLILRGISGYGNGTKGNTDTATGEALEEDKAKAKALSTIASGAIRKIAMLRTWDLMISLLAETVHEPR